MQCNEPIPKSQFSEHEKSCRPIIPKKPLPPPTSLEQSSYFQTRKAIEDKKAEARKDRYMQRMDRLVDSGYSLKEKSPATSSPSPSFGSSPSPSFGYSRQNSYGQSPVFSNNSNIRSAENRFNFPVSPSQPEPRREQPIELEDHENYCGSRTDKCMECGELVMFKDKQAHMASNHSSAARSKNIGKSPIYT